MQPRYCLSGAALLFLHRVAFKEVPSNSQNNQQRQQEKADDKQNTQEFSIFSFRLFEKQHISTIHASRSSFPLVPISLHSILFWGLSFATSPPPLPSTPKPSPHFSPQDICLLSTVPPAPQVHPFSLGSFLSSSHLSHWAFSYLLPELASRRNCSLALTTAPKELGWSRADYH